MIARLLGRPQLRQGAARRARAVDGHRDERHPAVTDLAALPPIGDRLRTLSVIAELMGSTTGELIEGLVLAAGQR
jgi:hypothetical protein